MARNKDSVYGYVIAPPRVTWTGFIVGLTRLALPFLAGLLVLDLLIWVLARGIFDACYGVWCWF